MAEAEDKKTTPTKRKAPGKKRKAPAKSTGAKPKTTKTAVGKSKAPIKKASSARTTKPAAKSKTSTAESKAPPKMEAPQRSEPKKMSWSGAFWHITALILFSVLAGFLALLAGGLSIASTLTKAADIEIAQIKNPRDLVSHWLKDCLKFVLEEETDMPFPFRPIEHRPKEEAD
ncbi:MAG: hypothetical protein PVF65_07755 [Sphingomonadales bacterium]